MRRFLPAIALLIAFSWVASPSGARAENTAPASATAAPLAPTGLWATASHDAVIQIAACGQDLCGQIVGMVLGPQDPTPKDWAGATQCRLTILQATPRTDADGETSWHGSIVDPRSGSTCGSTRHTNCCCVAISACRSLAKPRPGRLMPARWPKIAD